MMNLQEKWASNYKRSIKEVLVSTAERIHGEYLAEHSKVRHQLDEEIKRQMSVIKSNLNDQYQAIYEAETLQLMEKLRLEIADAKKKQWCWLCEAEALYFCCWNSNYCSVDCQQKDWSSHRNYCRRKIGDADSA